MMLILNNVVIETRESDSYVNATQICTAGGKRFKDWRRTCATQELIKKLEGKLRIEAPLLESSKSKHVGSWIHPILVTHLAMWVSSDFTLKVLEWIEEWKNSDEENKRRYDEALSLITLSETTQQEKEIKMALKDKYEADCEVRTPAGYIDLMSKKYVIEIKEASKWKHAIGQVLSYGVYHPEKKPMIVLFGDVDHVEIIREVCSKLDIELEICDL